MPQYAHCTAARARRKDCRWPDLTQFACFEPLCERKFASPKLRRHHLIAAHHYPPEFFFSVTNHGIGRLRDLYGDGASLVRKSWKARDGTHWSPEEQELGAQSDPLEPEQPQVSNADSSTRTASATPPTPQTFAPPSSSHAPSSPGAACVSKKRSLDTSPTSSEDGTRPPSPEPPTPGLNEMLEQMSVLSLVPRSVQKR